MSGYQTMRITEAAQKVQRSGFPEAYEDHAPDARALASALTGYSTGGAFTCVVHDSDQRGTAGAVRRELTGAYGVLDLTRTGARQDLAVTVGTNLAGRRLGWSVAAYLLAHAGDLKIRQVAYDGLVWKVGRDSEKGWQPSRVGKPDRITVSLG